MQPDLVNPSERGLMSAASELAHRLRLPTTFVKFLMVGAMAYVIFQTALYLAYDSPVFWFLPSKDTEVGFGLFTHPDIRLLIASVIAVEVAISVQFNSHERWTFRHRPRKGWILYRFVKFNLSAIVSPIIIVITTNVLTLTFDILPYVASTVGVLIGFMWNWTMNTLVIWPKQHAVSADERDEVTVSALMSSQAEE